MRTVPRYTCRIPAHEAPNAMRTTRPGPAFLYVLRMSGAEDLLKVGLSADPVARWSSFHRRWFEAFDLEHSLLVETGSRAEAQRLETTLHRALQAHGCPVPLTMRAFAGGATEWYRGPRLWPATSWRAARPMGSSCTRMHAHTPARPCARSGTCWSRCLTRRCATTSTAC